MKDPIPGIYVQYSKEVFSIISVDKKLVPILLEEMKWPPAGNFKSHSKYLLKFEEAVFLFNEDTMDFKKLVNYISEFVLQVRVLPYLRSIPSKKQCLKSRKASFANLKLSFSCS